MRIHHGDSVILIEDSSKVGIVERRQGEIMTVRFPDHENRREQVSRKDVRALAEAIYEARKRGTKYGKKLSLTGGSTLADLVWTFGYATQRLRSESINRVVRQLERAGLEVHTEADRWSRDERFKLLLTSNVLPDTPDSSDETLKTPQLVSVALPDPFWPTALGLDPNIELAFLRALMAAEPILCLLHIPDDTNMHGWLQATWEGLINWAFQGAQRFSSFTTGDRLSPQVFISPPAMLQTYLEVSVLNAESPRLQDRPHSLNLISLRRRSDSPVDFQRLQAAWPGPVFDFTPEPSMAADGQLSEDVRALVDCLLLTAGSPIEVRENLSPLKTLLWSKKACMQILAGAATDFGEILASGELSKFKGSNESSTALALKAHLAWWIKRAQKNAALRFEETQVQVVNADGYDYDATRVDLFVEGQGRFEVESMAGSGPMEAFYHQKVFARLRRNGTHLWLGETWS